MAERGTSDLEPSSAVGLLVAASGLAEVYLQRKSLEDVLSEVAARASSVVPAADGVGVRLMAPGRADTVVACADFVGPVDEVQYRLGEGPGILAIQTRRSQVSGSLSGEERWPRFGPRAGRLGVHSALSLPLLVDDEVFGALTFYGRARDAFDDRARRVAEALARPAAMTAANAQALAASRRLAEELERALNSRAVIDQAIGILMSRRGIDGVEGFAVLRRLSQSSGIRVADVADTIVGQAVARARELHRGDVP